MAGNKRGLSFFLKDYFLYITLLLAGVIAYFSEEIFLRSVISVVGSAMVGMSGALLGVVIAGLAIFVVLLDPKYIKLIERVIGFDNELLPIKTVALLTILCLSFGLGLIVIGEPPICILRTIVGIALWVYFYLLTQIWELIKWLVEHAKARTMQIQKEEENQNK
ncbi:MAG: hypothetical protein ACOWWR_19340 [Eubacteriales bacterium]